MRRPPSFPPEQPRRTEVAHTHDPAPEPAVSMRLRERLDEIRGARRRARTKQWGIIGGAALAVLLAVWVVAFSPVLGLKPEDVRISGTSDYIGVEQVQDVLAEHEGTPLIRIDTSTIEHALTADYPVRGATVVRQWPTGLKITLTPRTAVAATPKGEKFAILDEEGVQLAITKKAVEGLPVITMDPDDEALADTIDAVLSVMGALPSDILARVDKVSAKSPSDVRFTLEDGSKVLWGSAEDQELKASVLEVLLEVPASTYNVISPTAPITS